MLYTVYHDLLVAASDIPCSPHPLVGLYRLDLCESILGSWPRVTTAKMMQFILPLSNMYLSINWTEDEEDPTKGRNTAGNMEDRRVFRSLGLRTRADD